ncbi:glycosyltransferase [Flammeovirga pacifica]|uniref:Glycosyltransferase subfamily 4-like N-terminal domain-containing protein n=1 Tax=Flammeovirga pacifica TaxID=915059 RepID=A0A1S1YXC0_FLAPC|nr:glycosyltransferase [Flammeovirga pacifica]OHX65563.1 hypothetical protein NH26_03970 [Flammeovirga pacifica]
MKKIKVLSYGLNQANFILPIYNALYEHNKALHFDINNFTDHGKKDIEPSNHWSKVNLDISFSLKEKVRAILYCFSNIFSIRIILNRYSHIGGDIIQVFISEIARLIISQRIKKRKYNIVHTHFVIGGKVGPLIDLPLETKLILTFWGSDLLRSGLQNDILLIRKALDRADVITVQNREMKEHILVKYGRGYEAKIKEGLFIIDPVIFKTIDKITHIKGKLDNFKKTLGITNGEKIVVIGHNANENNNHLKILEQFDIQYILRQNIKLVLPFTYGNPNKTEYKNKILIANPKIANQIHFIENFLSTEELGCLRVLTSVFIQMPISDAMSAAVLESFYTSTKIIAGCWLPYGKFRRLGLNYIEIDHFELLKDKLDLALKSTDIGPVGEIIKNNFFKDAVIPFWIKNYEYSE